MKAVALGDRQGLSLLYERFATLILTIGRRMLRSQQDAEDLVHDILLEVWRTAHLYDERRGTVRTWIALRARSRSLDRLKSPAASRALPLETVLELQAPVNDEVRNRHDAQAIVDVLGELSDEQRAILELGYFEGLSLQQIAERLGLPVGTVKSRLSRALARVRACMTEPMGEGG